MFVYQMDFPIDDFGLMIPFKKYYEKCCDLTSEQRGEYYDNPGTMRSKLRRALRELARTETYWEGDVRGDDLYIGSVPDADDGCSADYYFALKQDNNGSSFIVSEFSFHHLHEYLITKYVEKPVSQTIQDGIVKILDEFAPHQKD